MGLAVLAGLAWRWGSDVRSGAEHVIALVRAAGPLAFFTTIALVPAPLAWFAIPAGEAFAPQMGTVGVIAAILGAVSVQLVLCFWGGRQVFRPWVLRWCERHGYRLPAVTRRNGGWVVLAVRLVPGPPLSLQCALLGLTEIPFWIYFVTSWLITVPWVVGYVVLGRGLLRADLGALIAGASLLLALLVAVRFVRRHLAARLGSP